MSEDRRDSRGFEERPHHRRQRHRRRRKERVVHTRISEDLDEALRRAADDLRVPVSNLVRNLLEDAFDVVESVSVSIGDLVNDVVDEAQGLRNRFPDDWRDQAGEAVRDARERVRRARREARERTRDARARAEASRESRPSTESRAPQAEPADETATVGDAEPEPAATQREIPDFPGIVGWQPFMLNVAQTCAGCSRSLARGDQGYLGISASGRPGSTLCPQCAEALS